jgi:ABC-type sugar transport system permease subunit
MEFLVGFFGGLLRVFAGLLNWQLKTKEPFDPQKFLQSVLSALVTGGIFQLTLNVDFGAQSLLLGWGTAEAVNKGLSLTGVGEFVTNFFTNALKVFRK